MENTNTSENSSTQCSRVCVAASPEGVTTSSLLLCSTQMNAGVYTSPAECCTVVASLF